MFFLYAVTFMMIYGKLIHITSSHSLIAKFSVCVLLSIPSLMMMLARKRKEIVISIFQ